MRIYPNDNKVKSYPPVEWDFFPHQKLLGKPLSILIIFISILRIKNDLMTIGTLAAIISLRDAVYIPVDEILYFISIKFSVKPIVKRNLAFF